MGANLQIVGFSDKIKTVAQARKNFDERAEQDRHENGHSYSGSFGMLGRLTLVDRVFETSDQFEEFLQNKGKDVGYLAQVKTFKPSKPYERARQAVEEARRALQRLERGYDTDFENGWKQIAFKVTPAQKRRAQAKLDKAREKFEKIKQNLIVKSNKTRFIAGGWVSE